MRVGQGDPPWLKVAEPLAGLEIAFRLEPLGALFALMASLLWGVNSLFSVGYMPGAREPIGSWPPLSVRLHRSRPSAAGCQGSHRPHCLILTNSIGFEKGCRSGRWRVAPMPLEGRALDAPRGPGGEPE